MAERWADPNLGDYLSRRIASSVGHLKKSSFSPALAYGRHRGPADALAQGSLRHAAVLIAMNYVDGQWVLPLTLRPMTLSHHGGQICLPGGRIELDETPLDAALREYEEELGIAATVDNICGELRQQYVFGSDNRVHPMVITAQMPDSDWMPDPVEVDEVVSLPLRTLLQPDSHTVVPKSRPVRQDGNIVGELAFSAPAIQLDNHVIWGATAMILGDLAHLLH
ncbi:NUDIX hydrolase [Planctomycetes bacterium K23_9]|uniref:Putative NUDIX hydrolase n=1 Tax=Stieleria marina TaxID=1930275 RepID=A0A517NQ22_9BACT|nr:putative NUDIX hydrolase [Planctomycetes bacterium K23_9]